MKFKGHHLRVGVVNEDLLVCTATENAAIVGGKGQKTTSFSCFVSITVEFHSFWLWLRDHNRTVLSSPPETKRLPSSENFIEKISPVWPVSSRQRNNCDDSTWRRRAEKQLTANDEGTIGRGLWGGRAAEVTSTTTAAAAVSLFI